MRKRFEAQLKFGQTPIEDVKIPEKSRDELPPRFGKLAMDIYKSGNQ